jgi:prevent-host-death family protein
MQVGIRDLKNKLTQYIEMAKSGRSIIITDRGVPVAVLHNLDRIEQDAGIEERLAHLAGQGLLTLPRILAKPAFLHVDRAEVKGEPVSEMIIRERR